MSDDVCITTLDCKLHNVLIDKKLLNSVKSINNKITEILWITSIVSNYVILHLLDNNLEILPLDRNFYFAIIYSITNSNRKLSSKIQIAPKPFYDK